MTSGKKGVWHALQTSTGGRARLVWSGVSVVVLVAAYLVARSYLEPVTTHGPGRLLVVSSNWSAFGLLFVIAMAVERVIEPFSEYLGPSDDALKEKLTDVDAAVNPGGASTAATAVKAGHSITAVVTFAVATALAWLLCGCLKILLLSAIVDTVKGGTPSPGWDLLVTGLVVGAGTKPLHDLVTTIAQSGGAAT